MIQILWAINQCLIFESSTARHFAYFYIRFNINYLKQQQILPQFKPKELQESLPAELTNLQNSQNQALTKMEHVLTLLFKKKTKNKTL